MSEMLVRVNGDRLVYVIPLEDFPSGGDNFTPVDCRDSRTGMTSQAIVEASVAARPETLLADSQVRDAIRSAYLNATSQESGRYPVGGVVLSGDFTVEVVKNEGVETP